jgi:histidinol dehydrogenase
MGSARFASPLSVEDFLKVTHVVALDKSTLQELSQPAVIIAKAEGLDAHAQAIALRVIASEAKQSQPSPLMAEG